jgi:hypothetical protein
MHRKELEGMLLLDLHCLYSHPMNSDVNALPRRNTGDGLNLKMETPAAE